MLALKNEEVQSENIGCMYSPCDVGLSSKKTWVVEAEDTPREVLHISQTISEFI